jgi:hypothetical protein
MKPYLENTTEKRAVGVPQVVESLPSKYEALRANLSTTKKKKKKNSSGEVV